MAIRATSAELRASRQHQTPYVSTTVSTNSEGGLMDGHLIGRREALTFVEPAAQVTAGFLLALLGQREILPVLDVHLPFTAHAVLAAVSTAFVLGAAYLVRHAGEHMAHLRRQEERARQERLHKAFARGRI